MKLYWSLRKGVGAAAPFVLVGEHYLPRCTDVGRFPQAANAGHCGWPVFTLMLWPNPLPPSHLDSCRVVLLSGMSPGPMEAVLTQDTVLVVFQFLPLPVVSVLALVCRTWRNTARSLAIWYASSCFAAYWSSSPEFGKDFPSRSLPGAFCDGLPN